MNIYENKKEKNSISEDHQEKLIIVEIYKRDEELGIIFRNYQIISQKDDFLILYQIS